MEAVKKLLKMVIFAAAYAAILVVIVGFITKPLSNYIVENDKIIAGIAGAIGFIVPIIVTFIVSFVLKKILNQTFKKMFMSVWTFLFTVGFIVLFSYLLIDGFGKGLIVMLMMIVSVTLTFIRMGKKRDKYIENVKKQKG